MTVVDGVVVVAAVALAALGWQVGGAVMAGFATGFGAGLVLGTAYAPLLIDPFGEGGQFVVVVLLVFGGATLLAVGGYHAGTILRDQVRDVGGDRADRTVGTVLGGLAAIAIMWIAGSALAAGPASSLTASVHGSALLSATDRVLPGAPSLVTDVGRHLSDATEPSLFDGFEPRVPEPTELPDEAEVAAASAAGREATVQILADDCRLSSAGSGVVVDDGTVITNAHVIAGTDRPEVIADDGAEHTAVPLLFDPELDVAVLDVPDLPAAPLPLLDDALERGATAAVLGYPEPDRTYRAKPAVVLDRLIARGRDLFDDAVVDRQIYRLTTDARRGGSGGPLVRADGTVIGIMFARGGNHPGVGYALTTPVIRERVDDARGDDEPVSTGACLS